MESLSTGLVHLLYRRELGLPMKKRGRSVRNSRCNYRCNFELLRTLLSDKETYLEVIACRKVSRGDEPSFCHNRLFTNNYRSWFNLCTSPTSGPMLMKTNIFQNETMRSDTPSARIRIVDAATMTPRSNCTPLPNSQHLPCILLLSKDGWLYQYSLDNAACLNKIFIPTNFFADEISNTPGDPGVNIGVEKLQTRKKISSIRFTYQYMSVLDDDGEVVIRSSLYTNNGEFYVANLILGLFPLRILNHFVTISRSSNLKSEFMSGLLVLTMKTGSFVTLYGLQESLNQFKINSRHSQLGLRGYFRNISGYLYNGLIGDFMIGLPYTTNAVELDFIKEQSELQLFETKAVKHVLRIGGVPYHYAVPVDTNCTTWSLRRLSDKKEVSKFHLDETWNKSHLYAFDFHSDDSGRILLINNDTVTVYHLNNDYLVPVTSSALNAVSLTPMQQLSDHGFQLRLIDSPFLSCRRNQKSKSVVKKCFEIKVNVGENSARSEEGGEPRWQYPTSRHQLAQSAYGRVLRTPQRLASAPLDGSEFGVLCVSYEDELDIIAVLHLNAPPAMQNTYSPGAHFDLVVSLYDNQNGKMINSVLVEQDLQPSDTSEVNIILDEDTVIYTRTEMPNLLNYKIMRFCRKR